MRSKAGEHVDERSGAWYWKSNRQGKSSLACCGACERGRRTIEEHTESARAKKKKKKKVSTDNKSLFWPPYISGIRLSKVRQSVVKAQSPENDFAGGHRPSGVSPAEGLAGPSSSLLSYFRVVLKGRITHACLSWYCPVYVVR